MPPFQPRHRAKQLRVARGLSCTAAADAIGMSHHTLEHLEKGAPVRESTAKRVAEFYDVAVAEVAPDLLGLAPCSQVA